MKDPGLLTTAPEQTSEGLSEGIESWASGLRRCHALRAAVELSVFGMTRTLIGSEELADALDLDPVMTGMLCGCLADMGLLEERDGRFRSTEAASLYLDPGSPRYQGTVLGNMFDRMNCWLHLTGIVRHGPERASSGEVYGDRWLNAIAESSLGGGIAAVVSAVESATELPDEGSFLDLGGGHGLYTVAFLHRHPGLKGRLFDRPEMVPIAERTFADYGCSAEAVGGDFYTDDLGDPCDVVFSSFNHSASDSSLCGKVFSAVRPGGLLILRRHLCLAHPDPLRVLEWNLRIGDGDGSGTVRYCGSWLPTSEEYLGRMESMGMETVTRRDLGDGSELVVLRRGERDGSGKV